MSKQSIKYYLITSGKATLLAGERVTYFVGERWPETFRRVAVKS